VPATAPAIPEPGTLPLMAAGIGLWLAFGSQLRKRWHLTSWLGCGPRGGGFMHLPTRVRLKNEGQ